MVREEQAWWRHAPPEEQERQVAHFMDYGTIPTRKFNRNTQSRERGPAFPQTIMKHGNAAAKVMWEEHEATRAANETDKTRARRARTNQQ